MAEISCGVYYNYDQQMQDRDYSTEQTYESLFLAIEGNLNNWIAITISHFEWPMSHLLM